MQGDAIQLIPGRVRISRQAWLTLALLVLIPTAALAAGLTTALDAMAGDGHPSGAVVLVFGLLMLLADAAFVGIGVAFWMSRRGQRICVIDPRGVTATLGGRSAFAPWADFDHVSLSGRQLLGWLRPNALALAHPVLGRLPRRNADAHGNVALVLGDVVDVPGALHRLRSWLDRDVEVA